MTAGADKRRACWVAAVIMVALGGCGSSGGKGAGAGAAPATAGSLVEKVRVLSAVRRATLSTAVSASAGQSVLLITGTRSGHASEMIRVVVDRGPAKLLHVMAIGARGETARATIGAADGGQITLGLPRWSCAVAPDPTFCPAAQATLTTAAYEVTFSQASTPIQIVAAVGSAAGRPAVAAGAGAGNAPPFTLTTAVRAVSARPSAPAAFAPTARVHSGDAALIRTTVAGQVGAAPQKATVTVARGPGKTITATSSIPGGRPSQASFQSADGKPIRVTMLRYVCFAPAVIGQVTAPCAASTGSHGYAVSFSASARTPILLSARVGAG